MLNHAIWLQPCLALLLIGGCGTAAQEAQSADSGVSASADAGSLADAGTEVDVDAANVDVDPIALVSSSEAGATGLAVADSGALYWINATDDSCVEEQGALRRVSAVGANPQTLVSSIRPGAIEFEGASVWVTDKGSQFAATGKVLRLPMSGGPIEAMALGQAQPLFLRHHDGSMYWANYGTFSGSYNGNGFVRRLGPNDEVPATVGNAHKVIAFDVIDGHRFFSDSYGTNMTFDDGAIQYNFKLKRMRFHGGLLYAISSDEMLLAIDADANMFIPMLGTEGTTTYAVHGSNAYVVSDGTSIVAVPLSGAATPEVIVDGRAGITDIAVDASRVYWTENGDTPSCVGGATSIYSLEL